MAKVIGYYFHAYVASFDFSLSRLELKTLLVALMKYNKRPPERSPFEVASRNRKEPPGLVSNL